MLKRISYTDSEPFGLVAAKAHLRVFGSDDDTEITGLITDARAAAEDETGLALVPTRYELVLPAFAPEIVLPKRPFLAVESVQYQAPDGQWQTLPETGYQVGLDGSLDRLAGRLVPAVGSGWPQIGPQLNPVSIIFRAGYALPENVPRPIYRWMLLKMGSFYSQREAHSLKAAPVLPWVDALLDPYREVAI